MPSWTVTNDTLTQLDSVDGVEEGSLSLTARRLTPSAMDRVAVFVRAHPALLESLSFEPGWRLERWDFSSFDFAAVCPALVSLTLGRCLVHPSVFAHPALESLELRESKVVGPTEIKIGERARGCGAPLRRIAATDSFTAQKLTFGRRSKIEDVAWSVDEDAADASPDEFVFDNCAELTSIYIHACGSWTLRLKGQLPSLRSTTFDASQYCRYEIDVTKLEPESSEHARSLRSGVFGRED